MSRPPAKMTARSARAAETRQRLIDTAVTLFAENDYDKVGVGEISKTADVAHGLLFHYFGTKRGIYLEAMRSTAEAMARAFDGIPDATPDKQIRAALTAHLTYLREHRGLALRMVLGGRGADPEAWQVFENARTAALVAAAAMLGIDPHNDAIRLVGRTAVAAVDETSARWLEVESRFDVDVVVDMLVHLIAGCLRSVPFLDSTVDVDHAVSVLLGDSAPA
ncbi:TetR/AcrR family transcriptional regulator [Rhodococcus sp. BP-316]|uniref:TetR/AcrR family transcriptional regulator n=1 Tax=unclassified Rhodococcus (in: high G+C Gram-positive bacteria) TaxID=192944 RepID=UPI001C9A3DC3|nr:MULTISPECIES: helix-turn-helix domain-containing protein [unclassified Rhodococcus (in: high G+C Gram-positive bacteria)]MBY6683007.1 TetR/AcrR family transcriptional regulator [Rhodococcus sp. BP-316]MBY6709348.1 TetR/AcrR family transcriptional regulator [Rhodococcus sp. BP-241]MDQ1181777.1 AcrR family transcriptional regulator [Rhodococcus sp. SORGH_AS_0301]MDQ1203162.1 AcrR family transcriptional regulator [Rhodococcus sp. SORGH_AS_0303]